MTDSVRCGANSAHVFTCEVHIDADPVEASSAQAPAAAAPNMTPVAPQDPAVSQLVASHNTVTIPTSAVAVLTKEAVLSCASPEISVVLAAVAGKGPVVGALIGFKAGFDLGKCLAETQSKALQEKANDYCESIGGVVTSVVGDHTRCEVRPAGQ